MAVTGPATKATQRARMPNITKYEVIEEIGHGGMATVYRAHDPRLCRDVAIKVIHRHLRDSVEIAHRFFVEAKAVAKLRHPNIVEVYDVSSPDEEEQYLVNELVRGRSLRKLLEAHGALPPEVGAQIAQELLAALSHAHGAGVIHRDIKPENVIIEFSDEGVKVKLTDFGIAKLLDSQGVTSTGQVLGSPAHMAPEQIEGGEVDARADVFGTGVLLYECLVGHLPFEGSNPAQVLRRVLEGIYPSAEHERATVGKNWSVLLDRALHRTVEGRFADANQMREALGDELRRLNVTSASGDLDAWMADPEGYRAKHQAAIIPRLCTLAKEARQRGDAIAAAADYNRALAYAPEDQALLRIVATMHRSEERRRLMKRLAPVVLCAVACGAIAFFAVRAYRAPVVVVDEVPAPSASAIALPETPSPSAIAPDPASAPSSSAVRISGRLPVANPPAPSRSSATKVATRDIVFRSFMPQFGIRVAVDGEAPAEVEVGGHVTVDAQRHVLTFTCKNDACEPKQRVVSAGEGNEELEVSLSIKPASLVVQGDAHASYTIQEQPTVMLRAGIQSRVPMNVSRTTVHVVELPSGRTEPVTLSAGQQSEVVFGLATDE
ncbi:serine/threonine protein kinase [Pendulispora brunnea]|uniref:Serine/threonine protein kinase n=1 Tax=Pendulispora brunnea TaxID=2905690 RepID=A0ABZ2K557_9BACT